MRVLLCSVLLLLLTSHLLHAQRPKRIDADLMLQQAVKETQAGNFEKAALLAKTGLRVSPSYIDLRLQLAHIYQLKGSTDMAIKEYRQLLQEHPGNKEAAGGLAKCYEISGDYNSALGIYRQLGKQYPADSNYLLKQFGVLEIKKDFDAAAIVSDVLVNRFPQNARFRSIDSYALLSAAEMAEKNSTMANAEKRYRVLITKYPDDKDALKGVARFYERQHQYGAAIALYDKVYINNNSDSSYLLKHASLSDALGQYRAAINDVMQLKKLYGRNVTRNNLENYLRFSLIKQLLAKDSTAKAMAQLNSILINTPGHRDALVLKTNLLIQEKQYRQAIPVLDQLLLQLPGDTTYMLKKCGTYELMGDYKNAAVICKQLTERYPGNKRFEILYNSYSGKQLPANQIGITQMISWYNKDIQPAYISSLQYLRRINQGRGSVIARVNYGKRQFGEGFQFEAESYIAHGKRQYSFLNAGISNQKVFPAFKAAYSYFQGLKKGWELEIGGRYLKATGVDIYSVVLGITKEYNNNWLNLKNYLTRDTADWYHAHVFTWRHFVNEKRDYFSVILGWGTSPDDRSRNFSNLNFSASGTTSFGLGYYKKMGHRSIGSVSGVWNNQLLADKTRLHQYDVYLSFFQSF